MAATSTTIFCSTTSQPGLEKREQPAPQKLVSTGNRGGIVLQPRVCTLRAYASDRPGVVVKKRGEGEVSIEGVSRFFDSLYEYVENSKKSREFEIISGRFAMVVFAATVATETITGNSVLRKLNLEEITKVGEVCLVAILCSASFAWFSSNRTKVGRIFTIRCNAFIDSLIDNLIDGLFYESDLWSDEM